MTITRRIQAFLQEPTAAAPPHGRRTTDRVPHDVRAVLESSLDATLIVAHDGRVSDVNEVAAALLGVPRAQLIGSALASHFDDAEAAFATLEQTRTRGAVRDRALAVRREHGTSRPVELSAGVMPGDGTILPSVLVTVRDVSGARQREADAVARATYTRSLIESAADPLFAISADGFVTDSNDAATVKTGLSKARLEGHEFAALFTDPHSARQAVERALSAGKIQDIPLSILHRDGTLVHVTFNGTLYRDDAGAVQGVFGAVRDVTLARNAEVARDTKEWVMTGIARLNDVFQGAVSTQELSRRIISEMAEYAGAQIGAFYTLDSEGPGEHLSLTASHAYTRRKGVSSRFAFGEGVIGQAALERKQILITELPDDYLPITSGLGASTPRSLCVTPLMFEGEVRGMLELGSLTRFSDRALDYLKQAALLVAVALEAAMAREKVAAALLRAQTLAAELEAQQDTLRNTNAELEEQTSALKLSEQKLKEQQAEIELSNTELNAKNELLERQKIETERARKVLAEQAEEVALASKYKSEFLANMSHELRTPLNSLLLLARSLRDNAPGNLLPDQVESASVIFDSGSDLLNLINEILDLSKIEAGKMDLRPDDVELADLQRALISQFGHMASAQELTLTVEIDADAPSTIFTDAQRLGQITKNLLGNAIKFTEHGGVTVRFAKPAHDVQLRRSGLDPKRALAVHVIDTGIGIPQDKQRLIFEAFQQADSGDRRRFGGTGLGLSISRELAALLGGEIQLTSEPGTGSTFSLYLPLAVARPGEPHHGYVTSATGSAAAAPAAASVPSPSPSNGTRAGSSVAAKSAKAVPAPTDDDRATIADRDHVVLIIEDDVRFAKILGQRIRERGFKYLHATSGEDGLDLARQHRVDGVVLDIELPQMDGWSVLNALKHDVSLRHIPVHIVSVDEFSAQNMRLGAIGHAAKPIGHEQIDAVLSRLQAASADARKRVLVVEDDEIMRKETVRIIGNGTVSVDEVASGADALAALRTTNYDLIVMDLGLPDMQGFELLKRVAAEKLPLPPIIIHTMRDLSTEEELFLRNYAESIIVKDVRSQERLIDEVALFLHRVVRDLPEEKRRAIMHLHESNEPLRGKKVLIVEDDMRTMFAMARMLAGHGVHPLKAENGERALAMLAEHPDTDLVLMDMMMPVMDGYEATRSVRAQQAYEKLPIIALTAKAMKEDRQRCLEAGATDYLSKPVDPDRLASLMRVLLCR